MQVDDLLGASVEAGGGDGDGEVTRSRSMARVSLPRRPSRGLVRTPRPPPGLGSPLASARSYTSGSSSHSSCTPGRPSSREPGRCGDSRPLLLPLPPAAAPPAHSTSNLTGLLLLLLDGHASKAQGRGYERSVYVPVRGGEGGSGGSANELWYASAVARSICVSSDVWMSSSTDGSSAGGCFSPDSPAPTAAPAPAPTSTGAHRHLVYL